MDHDYKKLTAFLVNLGTDQVAHTQKNYLAHLVAVYHLMKNEGCTDELCRAGMYHSIYGTEQFQRFSLPLERRGEVRELIGERAERLAFWNCAMDRSTFDRALEQNAGPYRIVLRNTREEVEMNEEDFNDLCRIHLFDWLEQVARSTRLGWNYRRAAYRRMSERLGPKVVEVYTRVFSQETAPAEAS